MLEYFSEVHEYNKEPRLRPDQICSHCSVNAPGWKGSGRTEF